MDLSEFRAALDRWLDDNTADLAPSDEDRATLDAQMAHLSEVKLRAWLRHNNPGLPASSTSDDYWAGQAAWHQALYDAGWMRWGWPERVGGLGGTNLLRAYLGEEGADSISEALQDRLPEVWNLCSAIQDEFEGSEGGGEFLDEEDEDEGYEEPCRVELEIVCSKTEAAMALRSHDIFEEEEGSEFSVDPLGETVFRAYVEPQVETFEEEGMDEDDDFGLASRTEEKRVRVGTARLDLEKVCLTAMNPVELELLRALVQALVPCRKP